MADAPGVAVPRAAMSDPGLKQTLRDNTRRAIDAGVFGVPTSVIDGQIFRGGDATDMMLDYPDDPALFDTPEMQRIGNMPMGLTRRTRGTESEPPLGCRTA